MKLASMSLLLPLLLSACSTWLPAPHPAPALRDAAPLTVAAPAGEWPAEAWWRKYDDATLNTLIDQALANAPALASAQARFSNAREAVRVTAAAAGLRIDADASLMRQRLSDNGLIPPRFLGFSWYNQADLGLRASYSFDWWHKRRDVTAAAINEARAAQAEQQAAALTLTGAIADSYFGWQADQALLRLADEQINLLQRRQRIATLRIRAELEAPDLQYPLEVDLAALRAARIELAASARLRQVVIAALLGTGIEQLPEFIVHDLPESSARLPDSVRVDLLARRPDIAASRWRIDAAQAQLQAARAEFMPDISINALAGFSSIDLDQLLTAGSAVPAISAAVHLPIFNSGLLKAQYGARAARVDAAVADYNATVVSAAREVATQALTLQTLQAQREQRRAQVQAAERSLAASSARQQQGLSDGRPALLAQQSLQQQRASLAQLDAAALSADIQLQLALGGGYALPVEPNP